MCKTMYPPHSFNLCTHYMHKHCHIREPLQIFQVLMELAISSLPLKYTSHRRTLLLLFLLFLVRVLDKYSISTNLSVYTFIFGQHLRKLASSLGPELFHPNYSSILSKYNSNLDYFFVHKFLFIIFRYRNQNGQLLQHLNS